MDKQAALVRRIRAIIALVLVALYAAGLVAMLNSNVHLAFILWVISTLGGVGLLYWIHTLNKRREEAEKARAAEPGRDGGSKDGQSPCA